MGGAVLRALLQAGFNPADVRATTLDAAAAAGLASEGVTVTDNVAAVCGADTVLVATKPADVARVLTEVSGHLDPSAVVVSLAAGVTTAALEAVLPTGIAVVRVMPNTPALVGQGMLAASPGSSCPPERLAAVVALLAPCGDVVDVPEKHQDAVTAVSGSGPAYLFYLVEAMIEGGVAQGLPRPVAHRLATRTAYGAAAMLLADDAHPALLREQVTSPGGTTAAALRTLDARAVRAAVVDAVEAATERSRQLG